MKPYCSELLFCQSLVISRYVTSSDALRVHSFGMIRIRISDPRSLGSWQIKGTDESTLYKDSLVHLINNNLSYLGSLILIISKECTLKVQRKSDFINAASVYGKAVASRLLARLSNRHTEGMFPIKLQEILSEFSLYFFKNGHPQDDWAPFWIKPWWQACTIPKFILTRPKNFWLKHRICNYM